MKRFYDIAELIGLNWNNPASAERLTTIEQAGLGTAGLTLGTFLESARQNATSTLNSENVVGCVVFG